MSRIQHFRKILLLYTSAKKLNFSTFKWSLKKYVWTVYYASYKNEWVTPRCLLSSSHCIPHNSLTMYWLLFCTKHHHHQHPQLNGLGMLLCSARFCRMRSLSISLCMFCFVLFPRLLSLMVVPHFPTANFGFSPTSSREAEAGVWVVARGFVVVDEEQTNERTNQHGMGK